MKKQEGNWWTDKKFVNCVHESEPFRVKQGLNVSNTENLGQRFRHEPFFPQRTRSQKPENKSKKLIFTEITVNMRL